MKAKFLFKCDGRLWYEYRGMTYSVDPSFNAYHTQREQHQEEQEWIDNFSDTQSKIKSKPIDWDEIWEMLGW